MIWEYGVPFPDNDWRELHVRLQELEQRLQNINNYQTFTPRWFGVTTDPAIGNGTLEGRMFETVDMRHISIELVAGSTTTFGTGAWTFQMPEELDAVAVGDWMGSCLYFDVTANTNYTGVCRAVDNDTDFFMYWDSSTTLIGPATPFTWANTDQLFMSLTYRFDTAL